MWYVTLNSVYKRRRDLIWKLADALNCTYDKAATGMFVWAKLPANVKSEAFIDMVLQNNHVFITPGTIFGSQGEGYIRFSLCASVDDIETCIARVKLVNS
jgi:aspartate/methionine/tyrosine aminotransferase